MIKENSEKEIFKGKEKQKLIDQTSENLNYILTDTFEGEDINVLKSIFEGNIKLKDIVIKLSSVIINLDSQKVPTPSVEIIYYLFLGNLEDKIGWYSNVFNETGEHIDEFLMFE